MVGGLVYLSAAALLVKLKIDDPLNAFAVHGASGMWGLIAAVLFDWGMGFEFFHGWNSWRIHTQLDGSPTTFGQALAANLAEIAFVWAWSGAVSFAIFFVLKLVGWLRVSEEE